MRLCEALLKYEKENRYPCHMPGHKGNHEGSFLGDILKYDITEIDGMDNLHDAEGIIYESETYAAGLYGSEETHFLVNGSTVGVLCAILGCLNEGEKILIGRNCHQSVYNAVETGKLLSRYLYPDYIKDCGINGCINGDGLNKALKNDPDIKAVVITSPTYEGIVSDVERISHICHEKGIILIVDSAHGAHFGFNESFPVSHVQQGADIVINSVHKTLPAPTQTALIHINGELVDRERIRRLLKIYQSSSPSYLLMAGIDDCMGRIAADGKKLFGEYLDNLNDFMEKAGTLHKIRVTDSRYLKNEYKVYDADPCKIMISTENDILSGKELYDILRKEYGIQAEMASEKFCLLIMTMMDKREGFDRIINALQCMDKKIRQEKINLRREEEKDFNASGLYDIRPVQILPIYKASSAKGWKKKLEEAEGSVSGTYVSVYPPGIPLLVPGEKITGEFVKGIGIFMDRDLNVQGISNDRMIKVYE